MTMIRMTRWALAWAAAAAIGSGTARADDERLRNTAAVLTQMALSPDAGIPASLLPKAKCIVVIPSVKKAALGLGGQYGRGYISCRNAGGWSAPGAVRIEGGSVGLQIGAAGTDVILAVLNDHGVDRLLASKFTVGADAGVAAGPVGREASAQTDATLSAEILAWSRSRGAYAGISLQGSTLREDAGENKVLYGREMTNRQVVQGSVPVPGAASALIEALGRLK